MLYSLNRFCTTGGRIRFACCGITHREYRLFLYKPTAWATIFWVTQTVFFYLIFWGNKLYFKYGGNVMEMMSLEKELSSTTYPGRGIVIGMSEDATKAVTAYFIMGRSENSRNRIFVEDGEGIRTQAFDPAKLEDPSLIIYSPVRVLGNKTIVTNGDQTDTIYELMDKQYTFEQALRTREFEPDAPNYTPRISGIIHIENGNYSYAMSILKSNNGNGSACNRYTYAYEKPLAGEGRFIHTYMRDANPLPSFEGEPTWVKIEGDIDTFTNMIWSNLNQDNKVSLFVRFIDIKTGKYETRIVNKNK